MSSNKYRFKCAQRLACEAHTDQKYGDLPYEHHLQNVVDVLIRFGFDLHNEDEADILIAAWLHDSLEDTNLSLNKIEAYCGAEVADIVYRVTDEPGKNRKERKEKTYPKIRESEKAIQLKLADRIANVKNCIDNNSSLLKMYQKEHQSFVDNLKPYSKQTNTLQMWNYLENLIKGV